MAAMRERVNSRREYEEMAMGELVIAAKVEETRQDEDGADLYEASVPHVVARHLATAQVYATLAVAAGIAEIPR
jgi:hypothetical protein